MSENIIKQRNQQVLPLRNCKSILVSLGLTQIKRALFGEKSQKELQYYI
jgi:hypothetical protein